MHAAIFMYSQNTYQCGLIDGVEGQVCTLQEGFTVQQSLTDAVVLRQYQPPPGGVRPARSPPVAGELLREEQANGLNYPTARGAGGRAATREEAAI